LSIYQFNKYSNFHLEKEEIREGSSKKKPGIYIIDASSLAVFNQGRGILV
jgi:hypothetical protein